MTPCFDCGTELHVVGLCSLCIEKIEEKARWHTDSPAMLLFKAIIGASEKEFNMLLTLLRTAERWEVVPSFTSSREIMVTNLVSNLLYDMILKLADDLTYWESVVDDLYEVKIVNGKPQTMVGPAFDALLLDEASTREQADKAIEDWWHKLESDKRLPIDWYAEKHGQGRDV